MCRCGPASSRSCCGAGRGARGHRLRRPGRAPRLPGQPDRRPAHRGLPARAERPPVRQRPDPRPGRPGPTTFATYVFVEGHPELTDASTPRPDVRPAGLRPVTFARRPADEPVTSTPCRGRTAAHWRAIVAPAHDPATRRTKPHRECDHRRFRWTGRRRSGDGCGCSLCSSAASSSWSAPCWGGSPSGGRSSPWSRSRRRRPPSRPATCPGASRSGPASTEVGRLTGSLNGMLTQIESAFRARRGLRGAHEAVRRRRLARAADPARRHPRVRRALPPGRGPGRGRAADDASHRGRGHPDGRARRGPAPARPVGRTAPRARRNPWTWQYSPGTPCTTLRGLDPDRPVRLTGLQPGSGPVPAVVVGDEGGLRQVVTNLVANAVRHTPAGTPVEVAVGVEPPSQFAPGRNEPGCAVLEVRDHGPGLPPEEAGEGLPALLPGGLLAAAGHRRGVRSRPVDRVGGDDRSRRNRRRPGHAGRGCDLPRRAAAGSLT